MAMLAGMTRGTADWQLDLMKQNEDARIWEEENSHSVAWDKMLDSVGFINVAVEQMNKATESLINAKDEVAGIGSDYKLMSVIERLEDLECELEGIRKNFINGEG